MPANVTINSIMECRLCGNVSGNTPYRVREMMLGTRDEFDYVECNSCGCLQIKTIPLDMGKYYPNTYYSFTDLESAEPISFLKKIRNYLMAKRDMYAITNEGILGKAMYALRPFTELRELSKFPLSKDSAILDIGSGSGHYLYKLKGYGFNNLLGVDPYIEKTINYKNGLTIKKAALSDITGTFDVIMLHNSLEHMEHQEETLKKIASLLSKDGMCLIRIPTVSSLPWKEYRKNWVHLDAPRHFFLHSRKSIGMVAEKANLKVVSIVSDATPFSFYGSEFYKRDIPATQWKENVFSKKERRIFEKRTAQMNKRNEGDTIAVILKKP